MGELFGTDGVRGTAGEYPLDPPTVYKLGVALIQSSRSRIVIGRDTRASGVWIEKVLEEAISAHGGQVTLANVITTPAVAFLSQSGEFDAGVMISASHNAHQDNGIKIFSNQGSKLSDEEEQQIERAVLQDDGEPPLFDINGVDFEEVTASHPEWIARYVDFLRTGCSAETLKSLKIVLDCADGAAFRIAPMLFQELGAEVVTINAEPNGHNINCDCGSLHPEQMMETVLDSRASFGVAFDGDSDRAIFCDENGNLLDGDHILFILSRYLRDKGQMRSGCVVTTVMANAGLEVALEKENMRLVRTRVGDRYVVEEMLRGSHDLGGEPSGHIIVRSHSMAGDGIFSALKIAQIVTEKGGSLKELAEGLEKFPQVLVNVPIREKKDFSQISEIQSRIQKAEEALQGTGRVLIRYSGTEPLIRIMLEGESKSVIEKHAGSIAAEFKRALGGTEVGSEVFDSGM